MLPTFFIRSQGIRKLYCSLFTPLLERRGLTQLEMDILLFLANNPEYDTARDIVEVRKIKANLVSVNVDRLAQEGYPVSRPALAAAMIEAFCRLGDCLGGDTAAWVDAYRRDCVTLGRDVRLLWTDGQKRARALDIDDQFGLIVRLEDGTETTVRTGEVSVRGLYGYAE